MNTPFDANSARIDAIERLTEQRFQSSQEAIKAALAALDIRLAGMNEFRASINDTTNRMMTRIEALSVISSAAEKTNSEVAALRDKIEIASRPNYPLFIGIISMVATIVTGVWLIIGLKIDNSVAPLVNEMGSLKITTIANVDRIRALDELIAQKVAERVTETTNLRVRDAVAEQQLMQLRRDLDRIKPPR
jgi:hypothetical protein